MSMIEELVEGAIVVSDTEIILLSEPGQPGIPGPVGGGIDQDARDAIDAEQARAEDAEETLQTGIDAEEDRADDAETALGLRVDATEALVAAEAAARAAAVVALEAADAAEAAARAAAVAAANVAIAAETARATGAEATLIPRAWRGTANGVAPTDADNLIPEAFLPASIARDAELTAGITGANAYTDAQITAAIDGLVDGAPGWADTLLELSDLLANDEDALAALTAVVAGKQAGHVNLTAFSAVALLADKLVYANGAGTLTTTTFTAAARTLLDDVDAPAMRVTLGLDTAATHAAGDFDAAGAAAAAQAASQPHHATLDGVVANGTTATGLALLAAVNAAAARATLALGTASTHNHGDYDLAGAAAAAQAASQPHSAVLDGVVANGTSATGLILLAAASVAAARAALNLGTAALLDSGVGVGQLPTTAQADARYLGIDARIWMPYGDGSDGAVVLDGAVTPAWTTRVGTVYTMTRNARCTNLTVNAGVTLNTVNLGVFCTGTFTMVATSVVQCNGANAAANVGGVIGVVGAVNGGTKGGNGGALAAGGGAVSAANFGFGGSGGNGGAGLGAGGVAGLVTAYGGGFFDHHDFISIMLMQVFNPAAGGIGWAGGTGGGGGGGSTLQPGGGAGAGGGVVLIYARHFAGTGTIQALGGNGGNATASATNGGGGGAGGGGAVVTLSDDAVFPATITCLVTKGAVGNGVNAGGNGAVGNDGTIKHLIAA